MVNIFVDTSFIIANTRIQDENHPKAVELNKDVRGNRILSDLVISETLTYIKFHDNPQKAYDLGKKLLSLEYTNIVTPVLKDIEDSLEILRKYETLSFCDALIAAQMKNNKISKILSFDSDFDLIPGIERVY